MRLSQSLPLLTSPFHLHVLVPVRSLPRPVDPAVVQHVVHALPSPPRIIVVEPEVPVDPAYSLLHLLHEAHKALPAQYLLGRDQVLVTDAPGQLVDQHPDHPVTLDISAVRILEERHVAEACQASRRVRRDFNGRRGKEKREGGEGCQNGTDGRYRGLL